MVHRLLVSYGRPDDPEAFDAYYRDVHAPLTLQLPRRRRGDGRPSSVDPADFATVGVTIAHFGVQTVR